ncbi:MAG: bifunctional pyr operon transcriptional regulator/uracil phosphoribosyltransferase PyrR [Candidatus Nanopelagicales bacterium]|nr:bifunctional pyr operon transcriptional regulator/uracil phosphoribosyltransferase PyrR [Candidatus Nanopelagicales bacterium]MDZ4250816.1 bifunctional pyr operon transcriptional regulator/uracil phosphoribosyltransferase PyrR [Candidatus Nanopelagicales bacterium]
MSSGTDEGSVVLDGADISRVISRMSHEIVEQTRGAHGLVVMGIPTRGAVLARRIASRISEVEAARVPTGSIDVTMYRDDLSMRPARALGPTDIPHGGIDGRTVVLVDDVLFSGRTVRAALDAVIDLGRPRSIRLAVLVDRGHRELPIRADYVGKNIPTAVDESVQVRLAEVDGVDEVVLVRRGHRGYFEERA